MRHGNVNRKFRRERKVRNALMKALALSLVVNGKIKTTGPKASSLRPFVEKLVTQGMTDTVTTRRLLTSKIGGIGAKKLVTDISPKYKDRKGGYTRITKLPARKSDGSAMSVIEFV